MNQLVFIFFSLLLPLQLFAQKTYRVERISSNVEIDGQLSEHFWQELQSAKDFVTNYPKFGETSRFKTEVKMVYDDEAIYIGAILTDPTPDSVLSILSQRDDFGNADWFGVQIDPYGKQQNGFAFFVTAAGVELDALMQIENEDFSWNAVWKSAVTLTESGWVLEIKIPFSAIRFPNEEVQDWNINFKRQVRRVREMSFWNPVDPEKVGEITQTGEVTNIVGVQSPLRLSLTPYITGYVQNSYNNVTGQQYWDQRITGGLDLKYGINDAFTLDMTLIPDFGQTISDNQVLNLSPFEVRFDENRPFFLEGTDLFGIGGVFYSRRIGGSPFNSYAAYELDSAETLISNPSVAPLINATKVSGRTTKGLGIGVFNAVENQTFARTLRSDGTERSIQTNPFTNYNVVVLSQNLKNNSSVSLVNTNTTRSGDSRDANVSLAEFNMYTPNRMFQFFGNFGLSNVFEDGEIKTGHQMQTFIGKPQGEWNYYIGFIEESDTYDPNDLGFLMANNSRAIDAEIKKNRFKPKGKFLRTWSTLKVYYEQLYAPNKFSQLTIHGSTAGTFKNFLTAGLFGGIDPLGFVSHFESRTFGRQVNYHPSITASGFYSSDYSKRFALDLNIFYKQFSNWTQGGGSIRISPRVRVSNRMFFIWNTEIERYKNDYGYVPVLDEAFNNEIILGNRTRDIVTNTLSLEYIFTKRMGLDLRFRHYWQNVQYHSFNTLREDGWSDPSSYNPLNDANESLHNTSFNAFTVDANYRWVFIPGSELRIAWKYNIFNGQNKTDASYFATFDQLFEQPQFNSISLKFLMYVDALYFRRKHKDVISE